MRLKATQAIDPDYVKDRSLNMDEGVVGYVARRPVSMLKRISIDDPLIFAGGVARNPCMRRLLEKSLEREVLVPEDPQMVGALGAAILAGRT